MSSDGTLRDSNGVDAVGRPEGRPVAPAPTVISLHQISKIYPGVVALSDLDLSIREGEIHGLVGENGAGKSTLLKILAGAHQPSSGTLEAFGEPVQFTTPKDARKRGIATVYQELTVLPAMSSLDNVFLGQEMRRGAL
jgi:ABC-type sugar transport system ATPase subunit